MLQHSASAAQGIQSLEHVGAGPHFALLQCPEQQSPS